MGLQDRHYYRGDGGGGFGGWFRRLGTGGFFAWSLPLFTAFGIRVRVHLIFVLIVVVQLIQSVLRVDTLGVVYAAWAFVALFALVLLHEFGHCFACRWVGGEADQILLWPLGGLASCLPPHEWRANLITTAGGPAVNLVLIPVLAAVLLAMGVGWEGVIFNPLNPQQAMVGAHVDTHAKALLFWLYYMNLVLFLFNVLLPMYPMDSGRLLQEVLWWRLGYERSMRIAVTVGLAVAATVGLFALLESNGYLLGVALFAGISCLQQRRSLEFLAAEGYRSEYDLERGLGAGGGGVSERAGEGAKYRRAVKEQERQRALQAEVDRILAKIAGSGMSSLTRSERKTLERETERKRGG